MSMQQNIKFILSAISLCISVGIYGQTSSVENDSIAFSIDLDEYIVTAHFEPTHYKEAAHRVNIINREEIAKRGVLTLDQALSACPAMRISQDPIFGTSVRMRGIGSSNVSILKDGVPVIGRIDGAIDISQISMANVKRIEIVEGAMSNIYGSNAAGGVVNIITEKSQDKEWKLRLTDQLESVGRHQIDGLVGYKVGPLTFEAHARKMNFSPASSDSLRARTEIELPSGATLTVRKFPFNPKEQIGAGGMVRYQIDDNTSILAKYDKNIEDVTDYGKVRRPQFKPYAEDRFYHTERSDASLQFKKEWNSTFVDVTSSFNTFDRTVDYERFYLETLEFDSLLHRADTSHFDTWFNRAVVSHNVSDDLKFIGGLNYSVEKGSGDRILDATKEDSLTARFTEIAPFIDARFDITDDLQASASARYTMHSVYNGKLTPGVHLKWKATPSLTARIGYAQGYRSPSLKELYIDFIDINHFIVGNLDLQPEISHDIQMTIDYEINDRMEASFNAYRTKIQDKIELVAYTDIEYHYDNIENYTVYGFQPSFSYDYGGFQFQTSGILSYWSTNIVDESVPKYGHNFDLNNALSYRHKGSGIGCTINHRHVGQEPRFTQFSEDDIRIRQIDAYDMVDFSLDRSFFKNRIKVIAGVRNILDNITANISGGPANPGHGSYGQNVIGVGRSYFVNLTFEI